MPQFTLSQADDLFHKIADEVRKKTGVDNKFPLESLPHQIAAIQDKVRLLYLTVEMPQQKFDYNEGDFFDITGALVSAVFSNGKLMPIPHEYLSIEAIPLTVGRQFVEVGFEWAGEVYKIRLPICVKP